MKLVMIELLNNLDGWLFLEDGACRTGNVVGIVMHQSGGVQLHFLFIFFENQHFRRDFLMFSM